MNEMKEYIQAASKSDAPALQRVYDIIRKTVPEAEEGMSYGMPAFRYKGKALAGCAVAKQHIGFCPFSPPVIATVVDQLEGFGFSKGMVRFTNDHELPEKLLVQMIQLRKAEIDKAVH